MASSTPGSRRVKNCTQEGGRKEKRRKIHTALITRVTATCLTAIQEGTTGHKMMGRKVPRRAMHVAPGDTTQKRRHLWGQSWPRRTISSQTSEAARCGGYQQPCMSRSLVAAVYPVTSLRNTADSITEPLSAFTGTREGQQRRHPGTENKQGELNGILTGQE